MAKKKSTKKVAKKESGILYAIQTGADGYPELKLFLKKPDVVVTRTQTQDKDGKWVNDDETNDILDSEDYSVCESGIKALALGLKDNTVYKLKVTVVE